MSYDFQLWSSPYAFVHSAAPYLVCLIFHVGADVDKTTAIFIMLIYGSGLAVQFAATIPFANERAKTLTRLDAICLSCVMNADALIMRVGS